jgi:ubiquinone/menaquinone biosynthesis C-methylase UbiE
VIDYDHLATEYARHRSIHPGVLQQLVERGGVSAGTRVLEVGCGTGNYLIEIQSATGCSAIGVDPSEAMLAVARGRAPSLTWLSGRGEFLPVAEDSVDLLFNVDVVHHIGDRPAFFREAHRVLAPGALICTATDSEEDIRRRRPLSSHFPETVVYELARYPRIEALRAEMSAAGFEGNEERRVELKYDLTDVQPYRDRAFSSLHLVPDDAVKRGIARLESEVATGPVPALSLYTLLWGRR